MQSEEVAQLREEREIMLDEVKFLRYYLLYPQNYLDSNHTLGTSSKEKRRRVAKWMSTRIPSN